jgi:hypothetical protein
MDGVSATTDAATAADATVEDDVGDVATTVGLNMQNDVGGSMEPTSEQLATATGGSPQGVPASEKRSKAQPGSADLLRLRHGVVVRRQQAGNGTVHDATADADARAQLAADHATAAPPAAADSLVLGTNAMGQQAAAGGDASGIPPSATQQQDATLQALPSPVSDGDGQADPAAEEPVPKPRRRPAAAGKPKASGKPKAASKPKAAAAKRRCLGHPAERNAAAGCNTAGCAATQQARKQRLRRRPAALAAPAIRHPHSARMAVRGGSDR